MTSSRLRSVTALAGAVIIVAAASSGITYAATTPPSVVHACINAHGVLRLLANGSCTKGYSKVGIKRSGVPGPRGLRGPVGDRGPLHSGAQFASAATTDPDDVQTQSVLVPQLQLEVETLCSGVGTVFGTARVVLHDLGSGSGYSVSGSAFVRRTRHYPAITSAASGQTTLPAGLSHISLTEPADLPEQTVELAIVYGDGPSFGELTTQMTAQLIVRRGKTTASLQIYLNLVAVDPVNVCGAWAFVTPAG
jgi:hypothetical protein